jgi:hypothetical protein
MLFEFTISDAFHDTLAQISYFLITFMCKIVIIISVVIFYQGNSIDEPSDFLKSKKKREILFAI